ERELKGIYMSQENDYESMSVAEQIRTGLQQSIAQSKGQLNLRTTTLPARPPAATPGRVRKLRRKLGMSQSVFAAMLNVSPKLVQSWEQGLRKPDRSDLRLLQIIEAQPAIVNNLFGSPVRSAPRKRRAVA